MGDAKSGRLLPSKKETQVREQVFAYTFMDCILFLLRLDVSFIQLLIPVNSKDAADATTC